MSSHNEKAMSSRGEQQVRITAAFLAVAWAFVLLRIWTRTFLISSFGWDDATMILAALVYTVFCAAIFIMQANGGGTHVLSIVQLQILTKWLVVSETSYAMTMMIVKISLGIFFARIVALRWHVLLIYVAVGINILSSAATFFFSIFRCGAKLDDYVVQQLSGHCAPLFLDRFVAYQQAAITTLTDLTFVVLPIFILWNANMSRTSKLSVGAILFLATIGCVCSILRFRYIEGLMHTNNDFFWHAISIAIWSTVECGTCIIAGCLATLRPLVRLLFTGKVETSASSSYMKQGSRSFKSAHQSSSNARSQHSHTRSSTARPETASKKNKRPSDEMTCYEFLAAPGQDVIPLENSLSKDRKSTDHILAPSPPLAGPYFPWPTRPREDRIRRQTMHANWTVRQGTASDGRTFEHPLTALPRREDFPPAACAF